MSYMCRECGTVIMEDDKNKCPDCEVRYTRADLDKAVKQAQIEAYEDAVNKILTRGEDYTVDIMQRKITALKQSMEK